MGDRDESPSLPGASATTGRARKGWKVRSPPAGDEEKLRLQVGPAGRGAGRARLPCANAVSLGTQATRQRIGPRRAAEENEPVFGLGSISEATPELVSQDRGAGDLRVTKADEHRRILRSAQMGAGSNAGPHFSFGGWARFVAPDLKAGRRRRSGLSGRCAADKAPLSREMPS